MLATTVIDPLLSSPTQVQRHDEGMAATFPSSHLEQDSQLLFDSLSYSSSSSGQNGQLHAEEEEEENGVIEQAPTAEDDEEEDEITPFEQLMNRGNYLRQLRALALQDEMERHATNLLEQEEKKEEADFDSGGDFQNCYLYDDELLFGSPSHVGRRVVMDSPNVSCAVVSIPSQELCDHVYTISTNTADGNNKSKVKVLEYNSYLAHQRYYDDLKHVDITYMDYGVIPHHSLIITDTNEQQQQQPTLAADTKNNNEYDGGSRVVIEQRKRLGKGGFCWDAAFMLGEHVIAHEEDWSSTTTGRRRKGGATTVLELGAGTGLCGIMVGKATKSQVTITDLPELEELMGDNVRRNFGPISADAEESLSEEERRLVTYLDGGKAKGTVTSRVLRWGVEEDYFLSSKEEEDQNQGDDQAYDVIIGADIVASLYDPVALAQTLHALCGPTTKIYISSKTRLDEIHDAFDVEMARLFERVEKKIPPCGRLKNPKVFIIEAGGKRDIEC